MHKLDTSHCKLIICIQVYQQVLLRLRIISQKLIKRKMACRHLFQILLVSHKATEVQKPEKRRVLNCYFCTMLQIYFVLYRLTCLLKADHHPLAIFFLAYADILDPEIQTLKLVWSKKINPLMLIISCKPVRGIRCILTAF